jgi:hypothetical protein
MIFYHGASDSPAEAAEMSKFHELAGGRVSSPFIPGAAIN